MQATRHRASSRAKASGPQSERSAIESIFEAYGLPGWLGWGTYGAESTYGATSQGHFFGLIEPSYAGGARPTGNLAHDAEISARLYSELVKQYGSVPAAVPHYSGNSYTVSHVESLGKGTTSAGEGHAVNAAFWEHLPLLESIEPWNWIKPNLGETPPGKEVERGEKGVEAAKKGINSIGSFLELITSGEFWLRALEVVGGGLLVILALKSLTGAEFPSVVPVPV